MEEKRVGKANDMMRTGMKHVHRLNDLLCSEE